MMRSARAHLLVSLATTISAGFAGLAVHSILMLVKDTFDILPGFQPYEDFQRLLGGWAGDRLGSILPYLTGAMIWGFLYDRLHDHLPGRNFWVKGLCFALVAWSAMTTGFFLLAGHGLLGLRLGYGLWPAALMFPMLAAFSLALSFTHSRMRADEDLRGKLESTIRKPTRRGDQRCSLKPRIGTSRMPRQSTSRRKSTIEHQDHHSRKETRMLTFNVPNMSCGHCEKTVRETIASLDPEALVTVDPGTRTINVDSSLDREEIADALTARGYPSR